MENNSFLNDWIDVTQGSVQGLWVDVMNFLPSLLGALVIFLIGLIVASVLAAIVERVIYYLKVDALLKKADIEEYFRRANMNLNVSHFFGRLVYWFIVVAFLVASSDVLGFDAFTDFLQRVLVFIPDVIIAALILLASLVVANFLKRIVSASVSSAKLQYAHGIGLAVWWVVFVFGLVASLTQVGIDVGVINTLITGVIAMLALAGGLAFGLGGKEHAHRFLTRVSEHMKK